MVSPTKSYHMIGQVESHSAEMTLNVDKKRTMTAQYSFNSEPEMLAQVDIIYFPSKCKILY